MIDELAQTYAHYVALRRELSLWVEQSIRRDGPDQNQGGEDEANFALAAYRVTGEVREYPLETEIERGERWETP